MRWADLDLFGHVNNVTYVDYMQEARVDMFRVHGPADGGDRLADGVVVVRNEVEFLKPIRFRTAPLRIEVWVTEVRAATFTLDYEMVDVRGDDRTVFATATQRPRAVRLRAGGPAPAHPGRALGPRRPP